VQRLLLLYHLLHWLFAVWGLVVLVMCWLLLGKLRRGGGKETPNWL